MPATKIHPACTIHKDVNVAASVVELKKNKKNNNNNNGEIRNNITNKEKPQRFSWERRRRRQS